MLIFKRFLPLVILGMVLAACSGGILPKPTVTATPPLITLPPPTPTATPIPPRELTICLGQEPLSLYINAASSRAMWSVLEAVYDGPIDTRGFLSHPVILDGLPTLENGGAGIETVPVQRGQMVLDASGNLAVLDTGVRIHPPGCRSENCALRWDGQSPLEMEIVRLRFTLLPGILWSDGAPLSASDSVYAFRMAADVHTPTLKTLTDRTQKYEAMDEHTVEWTGIPGYLPVDYPAHFWLPLPEHAWGEYTAGELLNAEEANRRPLGWGAYKIEEWIPGDRITLRSNPNYYHAAEGLPNFDILTFRFLGEPPDNNLAAFYSDGCDIIDQTVNWDRQLMALTRYLDRGEILLHAGMGPEWEQLAFGIRLADFDAGYTPWGSYRNDIFGDVRMRQAFSHCLDRQTIVDRLLYGYSQVPAGFFPPGHPYFFDDLAAIPYDPQEGMRLLDQIGWRDHDGDPSTPRLSANVTNVLNATPLIVDYATTDSYLRRMSADILIKSLAGCGIQANLRSLPVGELYAPGPDGLVFGRNFDLAQFAWQSGRSSPCFLYTSNQIPAENNSWLGVNVTGFSNPAYDATCAAALSSSPLQPEENLQAERSAQEAFIQNLPAIPLYFPVKLAVSRPDLCGLEMDVSARSEFWNLEALDYGEGCN